MSAAEPVPEVIMPASLELGVEAVLRAAGCERTERGWLFKHGPERVVEVWPVAAALSAYARSQEETIRQRFNYRAEAEAALLDKAARKAVLSGERPANKRVVQLLLHLGIFTDEPWTLTPFGLSVRGFLNGRKK